MAILDHTPFGVIFADVRNIASKDSVEQITLAHPSYTDDNVGLIWIDVWV